MPLLKPPPDRAVQRAAASPRRVRLTGTPASGGTCFGSARLVLRPTDVAAVRPGEIAIVPVLSPTLIAVLPHAGAVVAEVGGALSNGAILARELRIPAVVAVHDATRVIACGDQLLVDGTSGAVERFPRSE